MEAAGWDFSTSDKFLKQTTEKRLATRSSGLRGNNVRSQSYSRTSRIHSISIELFGSRVQKIQVFNGICGICICFFLSSWMPLSSLTRGFNAEKRQFLESPKE